MKHVPPIAAAVLAALWLVPAPRSPAQTSGLENRHERALRPLSGAPRPGPFDAPFQYGSYGARPFQDGSPFPWYRADPPRASFYGYGYRPGTGFGPPPGGTTGLQYGYYHAPWRPPYYGFPSSGLQDYRRRPLAPRSYDYAPGRQWRSGGR